MKYGVTLEEGASDTKLYNCYLYKYSCHQYVTTGTNPHGKLRFFLVLQFPLIGRIVVITNITRGITSLTPFLHN